MNHLEETGIQAWLDGDQTMDQKAVSGHIRHCTACRKTLAVYKLLYRELEQPENLFIPRDFEDRVMARIAAESESKAFRRLEKIGVLLPAPAAVYFLVRWTEPDKWFDGFGWIQTLKQLPHYFRSGIEIFAEIPSASLSWIGIGLIVLFCMMLLDKALASRWHHTF